MILLKTTLSAFALLILSCGTTKKETMDSDNSHLENTVLSLDAEREKQHKEMIEAGYQLGEIVTSNAEGDCPIVIRLSDKTGTLLDPTNLQDGFEQPGLKVWITFRGLRMMNRCDKANPIELNDIKKSL